jgi:type I restriction enzyme S subunit
MKLFFAYSWEQRKLENLINIQSGMDYKKLGPGSVPVYGTGGYMLSVNQALSYHQNAIGIGRKGTIDKPFLLKAPFWTVDTLFYAIPKDGSSLSFDYCLFQRVDWKSKDESTGVPSLSKATINNALVCVPSANEQKQIGIFFSRIDSSIVLHQRE